MATTKVSKLSGLVKKIADNKATIRTTTPYSGSL
jgi:hypothetical protein